MQTQTAVAVICLMGLLFNSAFADGQPPFDVRHGQETNPDWLHVNVRQADEKLFLVDLQLDARDAGEIALARYDLTLQVGAGDMKGLRLTVPVTRWRSGFAVQTMALPQEIASNATLVLEERLGDPGGMFEFDGGRMYRIHIGSYANHALQRDTPALSAAAHPGGQPGEQPGAQTGEQSGEQPGAQPGEQAQKQARADDAEAGEREAMVVVGYLPDYHVNSTMLDDEQLGLVTDLIYFSLEVPDDGVIPLDAINPQHLAKLTQIKQRIGCRLLLCLGGWERSDGFPGVARDPALRQALVQSLLALCQAHGFDGVDYDWEHPANQQELDDYAALIEDTARVFGEHDLLVTVALGAWQDLGTRAYQALDRVHLMCYDQPFPQATMAHAREEVARLLAWGCPPEKIALGIPFYGRNDQRAARTYAQLVKDQAAFSPDDDIVDGYAFNGQRTVAAKTRFALDMNLAGVMIWELTQDTRDERSLLRAIAGELARQGHAEEGRENGSREVEVEE